MIWNLIGPLITIFLTIINIVILITVKFTDLKHLEEKVKNHSSHIDDLYNKQDSLGQRVARVEGKMNGHKKIIKLKKK